MYCVCPLTMERRLGSLAAVLIVVPACAYSAAYMAASWGSSRAGGQKRTASTASRRDAKEDEAPPRTGRPQGRGDAARMTELRMVWFWAMLIPLWEEWYGAGKPYSHSRTLAPFLALWPLISTIMLRGTQSFMRDNVLLLNAVACTLVLSEVTLHAAVVPGAFENAFAGVAVGVAGGVGTGGVGTGADAAKGVEGGDALLSVSDVVRSLWHASNASGRVGRVTSVPVAGQPWPFARQLRKIGLIEALVVTTGGSPMQLISTHAISALSTSIVGILRQENTWGHVAGMILLRVAFCVGALRWGSGWHLKAAREGWLWSETLPIHRNGLRTTRTTTFAVLGLVAALCMSMNLPNADSELWWWSRGGLLRIVVVALLIGVATRHRGSTPPPPNNEKKRTAPPSLSGEGGELSGGDTNCVVYAGRESPSLPAGPVWPALALCAFLAVLRKMWVEGAGGDIGVTMQIVRHTCWPEVLCDAWDYSSVAMGGEHVLVGVLGLLFVALLWIAVSQVVPAREALHRKEGHTTFLHPLSLLLPNNNEARAAVPAIAVASTEAPRTTPTDPPPTRPTTATANNSKQARTVGGGACLDSAIAESRASAAPLMQSTRDLVDALCRAVFEGSLEQLERMLGSIPAQQVTGMVNTPDQEGSTLLHVAVYAGHLACVERLLAVPGIDVNRIDGLRGLTPLHSAVVEKQYACVGALLSWVPAAGQAGVDVNALVTLVPAVAVGAHAPAGAMPHIAPLHDAVFRCDEESVRLLVAAPGIDVNLPDVLRAGARPLHLAVVRDAVTIIDLLLATPGVDVNATDGRGSTPLIIATSFGKSKCLERLLSVPGVDVNLTGNDGIPPLASACTFVRTALGQVAPSDGRTPIDPDDDPARCVVQLLQTRRVRAESLSHVIERLKGYMPTRPEIDAAGTPGGQPLDAWQMVARHLLPVLRAQLRGERRWCGWCLRLSPDLGLDLCAACLLVGYCNREVCQKRHWKYAHKNECAGMAAEHTRDEGAGGAGGVVGVGGGDGAGGGDGSGEEGSVEGEAGSG